MLTSPLILHGIHPRILKEVVDVGAGPLSIIYPMSWDSGEGPADWKPASVIPIYKMGMMKHPETYRPVGLTSVPGKITDKMVWTHLQNNAITRHSQHGLTKGKSCLTNSVSFHIPGR